MAAELNNSVGPSLYTVHGRVQSTAVHRVHESNELTRAEVETRVRGGGVVEALGAMRRHRSLERGVRGVRR